MSGLRRLVDEGGSESDKALLHAARTDAPPDGAARARTLEALAAGAAAAGTMTGVGKGTVGALSKLLSSTAVKVLAVVVVGGGLGVGGLLVTRQQSERPAVTSTTEPASAVTAAMAIPVATALAISTAGVPSNVMPTPTANAMATATPMMNTTANATVNPPANAASTSVARLTASPSGATTESLSPPASALRIPSDPTSTATSAGGAAMGGVDSRPPPPVASSSIATELAVLDQARTALAAHDPGSAVQALDRYAHAYPAGMFLPEARVLRIQALLAAGDRPLAERLAQDLLRSDPNGPYAKRVREMMGK